MPKPVRIAFSEIPDGPDYQWAGPVESCVCGNDLFAVAARFHEGEIALYFLDARCLACGSYLTVPTPEAE